MTIKSRINDVSNFCTDCGAHNSIIYNSYTSERTCSRCGLAIEERIIDISNGNARFFSKEERNRRAQNGPLISNHTSSLSLSTIIPPVKDRDQSRIFKYNLQDSYQNRNLRRAYVQLNRIYASLQLPNTTKGEAERLYLRALKKNLIKGHSIIGMVAACIFYVAKKYKNNIREREVAEQLKGCVKSKDPQKHVRKCYLLLLKELGLKTQLVDPISLIPRYVSELGLGQNVECLTIEFYKKYAPHIDFTGKNPKGIAAASVYITCQIHKIRVLQIAVAKVAGITDVTLRERMRQFNQFIPI